MPIISLLGPNANWPNLNTPGLPGDKSQLYMRFILIYLVFCIVYHLFWYFYVCFYLVGDVQVEGSKNEQNEAKRSQKRRFWAKQESMSRYGFIMPQHEVNSSQKPEANMSQHAQIMPQHAKAV